MKRIGVMRAYDHPRAKLTENDVIAIRHRYKRGETLRQLARCFYVSSSTISDVVNRRSWVHVKDE